MLAQLIDNHGLDAKVVAHDAVSRSNIIGFEGEGAAMVCISYLDIAGNPAHLRYLLRRLRQRVPEACILVGLWPADDAVLHDDNLRTAIGADYYVTSLREAVAACLEVAHKASARHARTNGTETDDGNAQPGAAAAIQPEPVAARP